MELVAEVDAATSQVVGQIETREALGCAGVLVCGGFDVSGHGLEVVDETAAGSGCALHGAFFGEAADGDGFDAVVDAHHVGEDDAGGAAEAVLEEDDVLCGVGLRVAGGSGAVAEDCDGEGFFVNVGVGEILS